MARSLFRLLPWVVLLALLPLAHVARAGAPDLAAAGQLGEAVLATISEFAGPATQTGPEADPLRRSLGVNLADYANNPGTDPARHENFVDAARRILAAGAATKRPPDATSLWLDDTADAILAAVRAAEAAAGTSRDAAFEAALTELRLRALLARYHARRALAAVHYNLFKRGLRLAELVAATYGERDAVVVWRQLVADHGAHPLAAEWRAELKKLEWSLKELEDQCCPPDEALLKEKVWEPAARLAAGRR